jgi:hypothetical protein
MPTDAPAESHEKGVAPSSSAGWTLIYALVAIALALEIAGFAVLSAIYR